MRLLFSGSVLASKCKALGSMFNSVRHQKIKRKENVKDRTCF